MDEQKNLYVVGKSERYCQCKICTATYNLVLTWQSLELLPAPKLIEITFVMGSREFYEPKRWTEWGCDQFFV